MDTRALAGYIAIRTGNVTHEERVRLQKLLYYADGWSLAWTGKRLVDGEFEAWREGPVLRAVYAAAVPRNDTLPSDVQAIVDAVLDHYGTMSAQELTGLSHSEAPWIEARGDLLPDEPSEEYLSTASTRRFFVSQSLSGVAGPRRPFEVPSAAADADVDTETVQVIERWREALDDLAER